MNMILASFIKNYPEKVIGKLFAKVFWPPTTVSVLTHGENNDILALNLNGSYRLPGGFMDEGEDLKESAKREVKEETGFDIEITRLLDVEQNDSGGPEIVFEAKVVGGSKNGSWEGTPEFINKEEIKEKVWKHQHSYIHEYLFPDD